MGWIRLDLTWRAAWPYGHQTSADQDFWEGSETSQIPSKRREEQDFLLILALMIPHMFWALIVWLPRVDVIQQGAMGVQIEKGSSVPRAHKSSMPALDWAPGCGAGW
jgi:hypothetical protein